jgi:TrmH family RNA methyltransferase
MITSTANAHIKKIRLLRDRKERQSSGLFFFEGLRIVGEAIDAGFQVEMLVVAPELLRSEYGQSLVAHFRARQGMVLEVSAAVFRSVSSKEGPQGIAAVARQCWVNLQDVVVTPGQVWVALESVADPGNLGTILRTNDAVGGTGLILLDQSTDPYDHAAVRASMGAIFSQKIVKAGLEEFAAWKHSGGVHLIGTSGAAQKNYHEYRYPAGLVLLMGSERQGLQPQHLDLCDDVVSIPMLGKSDSLNLAVATGVVLYEILNQRIEMRRE